MMSSVNDLRNVNGFVKDARADSPAGSSTMSSAFLAGPVAYRDGLEQQEKQTGEPWFRWRWVGSIAHERLHPKGTRSRWPWLGARCWESYLSSSDDTVRLRKRRQLFIDCENVSI